MGNVESYKSYTELVEYFATTGAPFVSLHYKHENFPAIEEVEELRNKGYKIELTNDICIVTFKEFLPKKIAKYPSGFKKFFDKRPYTTANMGVWCQFYIPSQDKFWVEYFLDTGSFDCCFKDIDLWWKPIYKPKKETFI